MTWFYDTQNQKTKQISENKSYKTENKTKQIFVTFEVKWCIVEIKWCIVEIKWCIVEKKWCMVEIKWCIVEIQWCIVGVLFLGYAMILKFFVSGNFLSR